MTTPHIGQQLPPLPAPGATLQGEPAVDVLRSEAKELLSNLQVIRRDLHENP